MKISKIALDNIRCFENLEMDFSTNQGTNDWVVILGDNGVGKSTILRSIALGLTEESGASGLLGEFGSDWIRRGAKKGSIRIEIEPFPGCEERAFIKTQFLHGDFNEVKVRQSVHPKAPKSFNWDSLFVCGYGAGRNTAFTETYPDYIVTDAVYTLFKYSQPLQNPELNIRRIKSLGINERKIFSRLEKILMLEAGSITLDFSGIKISGPWGKSMPLDAVADGYQSTFGWIVDLFGWKSLAEGKQEKVDKNQIVNMSGIVLLDEIEQHLHPKWQKRIVKLLREQFPKIQFLTTSHSPLCVVGTTDLTDEECSILVLEQQDEHVDGRATLPPRGKRVDQVLTSYMFDLYSTSDNKIKDNIERYNHLLNMKRNEDEEEDMQQIVSYLEETLGSAETELEGKVAKIIDQSIHTLFEQKLKTMAKQKSPEEFELIRQLKDLL